MFFVNILNFILSVKHQVISKNKIDCHLAWLDQFATIGNN